VVTPTRVAEVGGVSTLPRTGSAGKGDANYSLLALGVLLLMAGGALIAASRRQAP
jgi:LPXTG-motif cell wall-anchored protein